MLVILAAFFWPMALVAAGSNPVQQNRFNVLFIAIDDLRPELGCYGERTAQTPHLDRFASQGTLFRREYVAVPTCGSSRYAMLTGRSPLHTGVTERNDALYQGPSALAGKEFPGAQTMPELFRRSGYRTICIGKISHNPDGKVFAYDGTGEGRPELPNAWDELATPYGPWKRGWSAFFAYQGGRNREDGQKPNDVMEFAAEHDEDLPDGLLAKAAVEKLQALKAGQQPFFLAVGFYKPHLPFVGTRGDWEAYQGVAIPPPDAPEKIESPYWHKSTEFYQYEMPFPKTHPLGLEAQIKTRRAYFACVRFVDRQVGKVLDALQDAGLAESTIVVVWSDNGWHLGEQQIWGKHTPFERALRTVLMIRAPGISKPGLVTDALVEATDIYPSLMEWCRPRFTGTRYPLDGKSLQPLFDDPKSVLHDVAVSFWKDAVSGRTAEYRLVTRQQEKTLDPLDLYDLRTDPDERLNLLTAEPATAHEIAVRILARLPGTTLASPLRQ